jgi:hypothetical protein
VISSLKRIPKNVQKSRPLPRIQISWNVIYCRLMSLLFSPVTVCFPFSYSKGIWDCMSNQEVIDFCRFHIAQTKGDLGLVCESIMDFCLAPDCDLGSVGCDNMTVVIVALLRDGQTYEAWVEQIVSRVEEAGLVVDDSKSVANRNMAAQGQAHVLGNGDGSEEEEIDGNY